MSDESGSIVIRPAIRAFHGRLLMLVLVLAGGLSAPTGAAWLARQEHELLQRMAATSLELPALGEADLGALGMATGILVALLIALWITLSRYYYTWTLHPEYMHASIGLVANKERAMYYENARIPTIRRGIIDRLLIVGSLEVSSTGGGDEGEFHMQGVSNPKRLQKTVMERIEAARARG
ncbi:PH domain-containing protein [Thioalkalivibrio sp. ALE23]|uniref:PH domain-containing protein n=1 Tax=Thioalkalivibrio sp. ALE23 TaxID=1265495 RepID=UPI00036B2649|nr:PH domain-containing protein [Thioalkalivibrio sp. ALE23]